MRLSLPFCLAALALTTGCPGDTLEPSLTAIQDEVFSPSCAFSSCHGGANPESGLDLTTAALSYASLVGVDGVDSSMVRVVAGDAESSLLYRTMLEEVDNVGLMPKGNLEPLEQYKLDGIRQWINDGALDN
jgi:hypothetical protein